jgi:hypothetical protein
MKKLLDIINGLLRPGFAKILCSTQEHLLKKGRDKSPIPEKFANGIEKLCLSVIYVGADYNRIVQNKISKAGFDPNETWIKEPSKISEYDGDLCPNGIVRRGLKDRHDQLYMRIFPTDQGRVEVIYRDMVTKKVIEITKEEKANYFKTPPKDKDLNVKQALAGAEKVTRIREYKVEGVLYFQKGDQVFNEVPADILDLFNLEEIDD